MHSIRLAAYANLPVGNTFFPSITGTLRENVRCVSGGWVQGRPSLAG